MPPKKRDVAEFGFPERFGKDNEKWRVVLKDGNRKQRGPLRSGPNAKTQAEEDLQEARQTGTRDAMFDFVKKLCESSDA